MVNFLSYSVLYLWSKYLQKKKHFTVIHMNKHVVPLLYVVISTSLYIKKTKTPQVISKVPYYLTVFFFFSSGNLFGGWPFWYAFFFFSFLSLSNQNSFLKAKIIKWIVIVFLNNFLNNLYLSRIQSCFLVSYTHFLRLVSLF